MEEFLRPVCPELYRTRTPEHGERIEKAQIVKRGWLKLRKGLGDHWPDMADGERILFITYLLYAQYQGNKKAWCLLSDLELCNVLQWKRGKLLYAKKALTNRGFIQTTPGKQGVFIPKYNNDN